ncbi:MAG: hypothetical protein Q9165_000758 [Trypethelium subeluteriae]
MADRHNRRRPFASWVKKLTKKTSSDNAAATTKKGTPNSPIKSKKQGSLKNNPYPESGYLHRQSIASSANGQLSMTPTSHVRNSFTTEDGAGEERKPPAASNRSAAPTVATHTGTINSDTAQSKAGTSNTVGGGVSSNEGAGNSTFSSPNHSEHSLTTTLTTIQSTAPSTMLNGGGGPLAPGGGGLGIGTSSTTTTTLAAPHTPTVQFTHQFPSTSTSPPPSAIPPHLAPQGHPTTYTTATANNLLTDNASILTLASSSKRRRRHSLDTDASVRALAPSSVWGGSRESLPLSVLSANVDAGTTAGQPQQQGQGQGQGQQGAGVYDSQQARARPGFASAERASVYSSSGIVPAGGLAAGGDRNSYHAAKQQGGGHDGGSVRSGLLGHVGAGGGGAGGDGASMRSGLLGHGRNDSITGSIGGIQGGAAIGAPTSPLASPRESGTGTGRMGLRRRSSDWKADVDGLSDGEEGEEVDVDGMGQSQAAAVRGEDGGGATKEKDKVPADGEAYANGADIRDEAEVNEISDARDGDRAKENEKPV